jgi:hypothetical protein
MVLRLGHFGKLDLKYLESSDICCWRRTDKIIWPDRV